MKNKTGKETGQPLGDYRLGLRLDVTTGEVLEELKGLGVNVSDLVREMLEAALPGLQGMVKALRAAKSGRQVDAKAALEEMAVELVCRAMKG